MLEKPNFGIDFGNFQFDATPEDEAKAEKGGREWIRKYEGPLTITDMYLKPKKNAPTTGSLTDRFEVCEKDPKFFKLVIELTSDKGQIATSHHQLSFQKIKYGDGEKATLFPWVETRKIMDAVGMEHISLSNPEVFFPIFKKYFGGFDQTTGKFPLWNGLKFWGKYDYTVGEFHMERDTSDLPYFVADHDGNKAVFSKLKILNANADYDHVENQSIRAETSDKLKSIAGTNNVTLNGSKLKVLKQLPGDVNAELLLRFETPQAGPVSTPVQAKPVVNDAHSLVQEKPIETGTSTASANDDLPF